MMTLLTFLPYAKWQTPNPGVWFHSEKGRLMGGIASLSGSVLAFLAAVVAAAAACPGAVKVIKAEEAGWTKTGSVTPGTIC